MIIGSKAKGGKEWGAAARKAEGKALRSEMRREAIVEQTPICTECGRHTGRMDHEICTSCWHRYYDREVS